MKTSFLRKIILQELKKVLTEDVRMRKGYNRLTPDAQAKAQSLVSSGYSEDEAIRQAAMTQTVGVVPGAKGTMTSGPGAVASAATTPAQPSADGMPQEMSGLGRKQAPSASQLASMGTKAISAAQANTPVGKLQAMLAAKGHKISEKPDNSPDGIVGTLTLQAIKAETGKAYSKDYVNRNANILVAQMSPANRKSAVKKEADKAAAPTEKITQQPAPQPMFNVDPSKAAPASKGPLDMDIEELGKPIPGHVRPQANESLAFIRNQFSKHLKNL